MSDIGDLGRYGEQEFKRWCASVGLVVNGSLEHDATGWDCKVEYIQLLNNQEHNPLQPEGSLFHPIFDIQIAYNEVSGHSCRFSSDSLRRDIFCTCILA